VRLPALVLALFVLSGCEGPGFAPIKDKTRPSAKAPVKTVVAAPMSEPVQEGRYIVQKGDTLYGIAFQNGLDHRDLAFWNNLESPDVIKIGQVLRLTPPDDSAGRARGVETLPMRDTGLGKPKPLEASPPVLTEPKAQRLPYSEANWAVISGIRPAPALATPKSTEMTAVVKAAPVIAGDQDGWIWPSGGKLLGTFGQGGGKGIDIAGERNAPVLAAAPGKVVYSGDGLRGYGKMLIVKHADEFLTAYAHNQTLLAKEGDWIKGGQKIAEMGDTDSDRVKLHFEVRQYGKPLDPLKYLPERK
jgi:Membrane proteins related to metalloendopeptidases